MSQGFKPVYRMPLCRRCPLKCKPCLTIEEAEVILADDTRRTYVGNALCQECRQKSNDSQNRWTYKRAGREFGKPMTQAEKLEQQIAELQEQLRALGAKV